MVPVQRHDAISNTGYISLVPPPSFFITPSSFSKAFPNVMPLSSFKGNTAHGNAKDGLLVNNYFPLRGAIFRDFKGYRNLRSGMSFQALFRVKVTGSILSDNGAVALQIGDANGPWGATSATNNLLVHSVDRKAFISYFLDTVRCSPFPRKKASCKQIGFGLGLPASHRFTLESTDFRNYYDFPAAGTDEVAWYAKAIRWDGCTSCHEIVKPFVGLAPCGGGGGCGQVGGWEYRTKDLAFYSLRTDLPPRRLQLLDPFECSVVDLDGSLLSPSLTGNSSNRVLRVSPLIVVPESQVLPNRTCTALTTASSIISGGNAMLRPLRAAICDRKQEFRRVAIRLASPSFEGLTLIGGGGPLKRRNAMGWPRHYAVCRVFRGVLGVYVVYMMYIFKSGCYTY